MNQYLKLSNLLRVKRNGGEKKIQIPSWEILNHVISDHFWIVNEICEEIVIPMNVNAG